jgi:hypothetical protein
MQVAVLPDQGPRQSTRVGLRRPGYVRPGRRGQWCLLGQALQRSPARDVLGPHALGAVFMPWFAVVLPYRRLDPADPPYWSLRELAGTSWSSRPWPVARCRAGPGSDGFLIGSALSGLGLGMHIAVDLALVTELLYAVAGA